MESVGFVKNLLHVWILWNLKMLDVFYVERRPPSGTQGAQNELRLPYVGYKERRKHMYGILLL